MSKNFDEYSDSELFYLLKEDKKTAEKAFAELFNRHSSKVYAYCRRFLGNKDEAQDVFQETFIRFHHSASQDREMTNVPAFLLTIARNLCVNTVRREKPTVTFEDYMVGTRDRNPEKDELLGLIKTAIELLPPEYKEVFVLREYDGLSYSEIAEITEESLSNVKVRIHRAKQKIRDILQPYLKDLSKHE
jgi:RNA polymerase sigma-70 factor (ECF subfamily)